jgi:sugar-specific transcriptional regulator TrmB
MDILKLCRHLGLSPHAAETYLALLALGQGTVAVIAREAKIDRPLVYRVLPELLTLGLIARTTKGKRQEYAAMPPERLRELYQQLGTDLERSFPIMRARYDRAKHTSSVKQLSGARGIVAAYDDVVNSLPVGATFYRYSSSKTPRKREQYVSKNYTARRDAKKLERFVITNKENAQKKRSKLERAVKSVPLGADLFAYDITEIIYGDKIAFIDYGKETATIIENREIAQFQERLFKLLYQRL